MHFSLGNVPRFLETSFNFGNISKMFWVGFQCGNMSETQKLSSLRAFVHHIFAPYTLPIQNKQASNIYCEKVELLDISRNWLFLV